MRQWVTSCPDPEAWALRIAQGSMVTDRGCWEWVGVLDKDGYGRFRWRDGERRVTGAHRAAWLALRGDIPQARVMDHLCRNRACCNPAHLEVVTVLVNTRRSHLVGRDQNGVRPGIRRPRSLRGCRPHGFTNGYRSPHGTSFRWVCRTCRADRKKRAADKLAA